jgi:hypothetical protein
MHLSRLRRFAFLIAGLACLPAPAGALITVGSLELPSLGTTVVAKDGLAYVGIGRGYDFSGLVIADVSNPSAPVEIGAIEYPSNPWMTVRDMVVEDGLAYLAVEKAATGPDPSFQPTGSLWIVDVSDPTVPVEIGAFEVSNAPRGIAVVDNLAYLTVFTYPPRPPFPPPLPEPDPTGLRVIDVANPSAPAQVGSIELSGAPYEIEVVGDLVYIADFILGGLRTIDVSDPTAPVEIDLAESSGRPTNLTIVDGLAYVTNRDFVSGGLSVFDLSDPRAPIEIGYL